VNSPLREITYHMGSHSVTCHPAGVTLPPLSQPMLVLEEAFSLKSAVACRVGRKTLSLILPLTHTQSQVAKTICQKPRQICGEKAGLQSITLVLASKTSICSAVFAQRSHTTD